MVVTLDHAHHNFVLYLLKVQKRKMEYLKKQNHTTELSWIKVAGKGITASKMKLVKEVSKITKKKKALCKQTFRTDILTLSMKVAGPTQIQRQSIAHS